MEMLLWVLLGLLVVAISGLAWVVAAFIAAMNKQLEEWQGKLDDD